MLNLFRNQRKNACFIFAFLQQTKRCWQVGRYNFFISVDGSFGVVTASAFPALGYFTLQHLPNVAKTLFRSTRTKPSQHNAVETFSFRSFSFVESIIWDRFQCLGRYISRRLKVYFIDELRQHLQRYLFAQPRRSSITFLHH